MVAKVDNVEKLKVINQTQVWENFTGNEDSFRLGVTRSWVDQLEQKSEAKNRAELGEFFCELYFSFAEYLKVLFCTDFIHNGVKYFNFSLLRSVLPTV